MQKIIINVWHTILSSKNDKIILKFQKSFVILPSVLNLVWDKTDENIENESVMLGLVSGTWEISDKYKR